jgi:hypothetical protein
MQPMRNFREVLMHQFQSDKRNGLSDLAYFENCIQCLYIESHHTNYAMDALGTLVVDSSRMIARLAYFAKLLPCMHTARSLLAFMSPGDVGVRRKQKGQSNDLCGIRRMY